MFEPSWEWETNNYKPDQGDRRPESAVRLTRGQRGHDRPVSLQGHCQQSEHRGVDLWINVSDSGEQLTWISLCWLTVTQLVNMLILQKIEPKIQWPSLIVMNLGK